MNSESGGQSPGEILYVAREVALPVGASESLLPGTVAGMLCVPEKSVSRTRILRKSLDARARNRPVWRYAVEFSCALPVRHPQVALLPKTPVESPELPARPFSGNKAAIVGSGPAGLAAALGLARKGYAVTVFEQGKPVGARFRDIRLFIKQNRFDAKSNILFGEGGAGTFSDGKLTARTRTRETETFLRELVACGAEDSILYLHHPHVGTDRLQFIIRAFRKRCESSGAVFRFGLEVTDLMVEAGRCRGVVVEGREERFDAVVLAPGLSAQRLYEALAVRKVAMERKGFSVGLRVEHPQNLVNRCQLGDNVDARLTGPAEYFLTWQCSGEAAYSFCMCPGGVLIPCADETDGLFTNGMSYSNRATPYANSAVVVPVKAGALSGGVLAGIHYQRELERKAFKMGGGGFRFPAQSVTAFLDHRLDAELPKTSFLKPMAAAKFTDLFEPGISRALADAFRAFERRMPGFIQKGFLIGPESRTSSPVRITRDPETLESVSTPGLFPIGEGAGYSGGIVSSGADGFRLAHAVAPFPAH